MGKRQCWLFRTGKGQKRNSLLVKKSYKIRPLEREPEPVADGDPDKLEDALAGHQLDEQDAEEAHLS